MPVCGIDAFLDLLDSAGVRYIFGNPGTTELPLNDALVGDERFAYILGLQEVPVMAMADGYAMASRKLGVVNLHTCCGLGNAMGMLYNAHREGTPLLVTAGQQDRRLKFEEPILTGDMVAVARPWTKWAVEVDRLEDLPSAVRRAAQIALTPPTGPVFMALPVDLQMETCGPLDLTPATPLDDRVRPPAEAVRRAAKVLVESQQPAILSGSRITEMDAMQELVAVAEQLGAPVFSESGTTHGRLAFPTEHPLNAQGLPLWSPQVHDRLAGFDVLLVVGMDLFRQYVFHQPTRPLPENVRLVHLDEDPWQLGKNYPVEVGLIGHAKAGLAELHAAIDATITDEFKATRRRRVDEYRRSHEDARDQFRAEIDCQSGRHPMSSLELMATLADVLPTDIVVVEEAVTTTNTTFERLGALKNTTGYFGHRGWALGWGLGSALGAKLAWPERPVLALLGEGAAMYGIQGLWSAAHHCVPVTFVICNNAQYQILKVGSRAMNLPHAATGEFEAMDLVAPEIDFVRLSQSLGVAAEHVEDPEALRDCVSRSLASEKPRLINVPISREPPGRLEYG